MPARNLNSKRGLGKAGAIIKNAGRKARNRLKRLPGFGFLVKNKKVRDHAIARSKDWSNVGVRKYAQIRQGLDFIDDFGLKKAGSFRIKIGRSYVESPVGIHLRTPENRTVGQLRIGFGKEKGRRILFIYAIHGEKEMQNAMEQFQRETGLKWPNYLVQQAEAHARAHNFKEVRILRPEYNKSACPVILTKLAREDPKFADPEEAEKFEAMKRLYYGVARTEGFKKQGEYFVKEI